MALQASSVYQLSQQDKSLWERGDLSIKGIYAAWRERRDQRAAEYLVKLVQLDPQPEGYKDALKDASGSNVFLYEHLLKELTSWNLNRTVYRRCQAEDISLEFGETNRNEIRNVIAKIHKECWEQVEADETLLPERLKVHKVIMDLWQSEDALARDLLLEIIREVPLKWGPWRAIKRIYKESIRSQDWVVFGAIAARLDYERNQTSGYLNRPNERFVVSWGNRRGDVSKRTFSYLVRLGWRVLRRIATHQPSLYPEVAAEVLKGYRSSHHRWTLSNTWIYNHILFHGSKGYHAENFYHYPRDYYTYRAYSELWARSPRPLLQLLEESENDGVFKFASESLLKDFRELLGTLDSDWALRMARHKRKPLDEFLLSWYKELCPTPQGEYEAKGLHRPLWLLLDSPYKEASGYAITFFNAHVSALQSLITVPKAMSLARSSNQDLRSLGERVLEPAAGYFNLDLSQWTTLLCDSNSYAFASTHIKQLFSAKDLSFEWFAQCMNSELDLAASFAETLLEDSAYRPEGGDLLGFYWSLLTPVSWRTRIANAAFKGLESLTDTSEGERMLNRLNRAQLTALLLHPEGEGAKRVERWVKSEWMTPNVFTSDWLKQLLNKDTWSTRWWSDALDDEGEEWRIRRSYEHRFGQLAQKWLLNPVYFKIEDLGETWLLKLALTTGWSYNVYRTYLKTHVPFSAFRYLPYLEDETLQKPEQLEVEQANAEGFSVLLNHLIQTPQWNTRSLLHDVLKTRHPAYKKARDPNSQGPNKKLALTNNLLTFDVFEQLAFAPEESDRMLAIHFARYELSRWTEEAPLTFGKLLPFFVKGTPEIQSELLKAMSSSPRSAEARIDVRLPQFKADDLYTFCFSPRSKVRDLGLSLIGEHPERFADPTKLATLAESSDRRVCEGVVSLLWKRLRFFEVTPSWKPHPQSIEPQSSMAKKQVDIREALPPTGRSVSELKGVRYLGTGVSDRPVFNAAQGEWLPAFLSRTVFRLSHRHPYKEDLNRLTPVTSGWRVKVNLIKALRDLAVVDVDFASMIAPILREFMTSRGQSERAACLVALTRIRAAHPALNLELS